MGKLQGKVALVTGAGSGIGLATAVRVAQEGAKLVLVGHNEQALRASLPTIAADCVAHVVASVTPPEDNERTIAVAADRFGGLDIFVANAGVEGAAAAIEDYPLDVFDRVMAVNVRGVFLGLKCAIPMLRKRGGGSVVVASSIGGIKARGQGNSAYIASKHAEIGLMRSAWYPRQLCSSRADRHAHDAQYRGEPLAGCARARSRRDPERNAATALRHSGGGGEPDVIPGVGRSERMHRPRLCCRRRAVRFLGCLWRGLTCRAMQVTNFSRCVAQLDTTFGKKKLGDEISQKLS